MSAAPPVATLGSGSPSTTTPADDNATTPDDIHDQHPSASSPLLAPRNGDPVLSAVPRALAVDALSSSTTNGDIALMPGGVASSAQPAECLAFQATNARQDGAANDPSAAAAAAAGIPTQRRSSPPSPSLSRTCSPHGHQGSLARGQPSDAPLANAVSGLKGGGGVGVEQDFTRTASGPSGHNHTTDSFRAVTPTRAGTEGAMRCETTTANNVSSPSRRSSTGLLRSLPSLFQKNNGGGKGWWASQGRSKGAEDEQSNQWICTSPRSRCDSGGSGGEAESDRRQDRRDRFPEGHDRERATKNWRVLRAVLMAIGKWKKILC